MSVLALNTVGLMLTLPVLTLPFEVDANQIHANNPFCNGNCWIPYICGKQCYP